MEKEKEKEKISTSIRLDKDLINKIKKEAKEQGRSITKQIEQIIIKYYKIKN